MAEGKIRKNPSGYFNMVIAVLHAALLYEMEPYSVSSEFPEFVPVPNIRFFQFIPVLTDLEQDCRKANKPLPRQAYQRPPYFPAAGRETPAVPAPCRPENGNRAGCKRSDYIPLRWKS
jgi:hypothetical protein